jgi:hypothetical protein
VAMESDLKPTCLAEPTAFVALLGDGEWSADESWEDQSV